MKRFKSFLVENYEGSLLGSKLYLGNKIHHLRQRFSQVKQDHARAQMELSAAKRGASAFPFKDAIDAFAPKIGKRISDMAGVGHAEARAQRTLKRRQTYLDLNSRYKGALAHLDNLNGAKVSKVSVGRHAHLEVTHAPKKPRVPKVAKPKAAATIKPKKKAAKKK